MALNAQGCNCGESVHLEICGVIRPLYLGLDWTSFFFSKRGGNQRTGTQNSLLVEADLWPAKTTRKQVQWLVRLEESWTVRLDQLIGSYFLLQFYGERNKKVTKMSWCQPNEMEIPIEFTNHTTWRIWKTKVLTDPKWKAGHPSTSPYNPRTPAPDFRFGLPAANGWLAVKNIVVMNYTLAN